MKGWWSWNVLVCHAIAGNRPVADTLDVDDILNIPLLEGWGLDRVICAGSINERRGARRRKQFSFSTFIARSRVHIAPNPSFSGENRASQDRLIVCINRLEDLS